jgi:hypothetical protein
LLARSGRGAGHALTSCDQLLTFCHHCRDEPVSRDRSSIELPRLFSDEEFEALRKERQQSELLEHDRQDVRGTRLVKRESDGRPESRIEQQFPHVAKKLTVLWPSEACEVYLRSLLVMDRETREGFPPEVVEDLLMLYSMNEMRLRKIGLAGLPPGAIPPSR